MIFFLKLLFLSCTLSCTLVMSCTSPLPHDFHLPFEIIHAPWHTPCIQLDYYCTMSPKQGHELVTVVGSNVVDIVVEVTGVGSSKKHQWFWLVVVSVVVVVTKSLTLTWSQHEAREGHIKGGDGVLVASQLKKAAWTRGHTRGSNETQKLWYRSYKVPWQWISALTIIQITYYQYGSKKDWGRSNRKIVKWNK